MVRVLSMLAVALLFVRTAIAADMPVKAPYVPPPFDWTGVYVGASGGYGSANLHGALGSLTLGVNLQTSLPLVFALESDLSFSDLTNGCSAAVCSFNNRWIETTRIRAGY